MSMIRSVTEYSRLAAYNTTFGAYHKLQRIGPVKLAYKTFSLPGFEKVTKLALPVFDLLARVPEIGGDVFKDIHRAATEFKDLVYAVQIFDSARKFVYIYDQRVVDAEGKSILDDEGNVQTVKRIGFQWTDKNHWVEKLTETINCLGTVFETGKFLQRRGVYAFESCTRLANRMGEFKIFDVQPFTYRPLAALTDKPKEFCLFVSSFIDLAWHALKFIRPSAEAVRYNPRTGEREEIWGREAKTFNRKALLSTESILRQIGNGGRMYLIWNGCTPRGSSLQFNLINFVTQYASLLAFWIKQR